MSPNQYLESLRQAGWAIAAIPPNDIPSDFDKDQLERSMINHGYDMLDVGDDEPPDQFRDDVEADADVLRNCGWGTDEDYGGDASEIL